MQSILAKAFSGELVETDVIKNLEISELRLT